MTKKGTRNALVSERAIGVLGVLGGGGPSLLYADDGGQLAVGGVTHNPSSIAGQPKRPMERSLMGGMGS